MLTYVCQLLANSYGFTYIYIDIYFFVHDSLQTTAEVQAWTGPACVQNMRFRHLPEERCLHLRGMSLICIVVVELYVVMCVCG